MLARLFILKVLYFDLRSCKKLPLLLFQQKFTTRKKFTIVPGSILHLPNIETQSIEQKYTRATRKHLVLKTWTFS